MYNDRKGLVTEVNSLTDIDVLCNFRRAASERIPDPIEV